MLEIFKSSSCHSSIQSLSFLFQCRRGGTSSIPDWLTWHPSSNTLSGIPSPQNIGCTLFTVPRSSFLNTSLTSASPNIRNDKFSRTSAEKKIIVTLAVLASSLSRVMEPKAMAGFQGFENAAMTFLDQQQNPLALYGETASRVPNRSTSSNSLFINNGYRDDYADDQSCLKKYPITVSILLPLKQLSMPSSLSSSKSRKTEPPNSSTFLQVVNKTLTSYKLPLLSFPTYSLLNRPPTKLHEHLGQHNLLDSFKFLCNSQTQSQMQYKHVQYLAISFKLPFCRVQCFNQPSDFLPHAAKFWFETSPILISPAAEFTVVLSQFQPRPTTEELKMQIQNPPWARVRVPREAAVAAELASFGSPGSGNFIDDTPELTVNRSSFKKSWQIPEGQYFKQCITPTMFLLSGAPIWDLTNYEMVLTEAIPNTGRGGNAYSWIFWNEETTCIEGLPMGQQEGFNNFYFSCTSKFNRLIHLRAPVEILVFKNKNLPNHKLGFKFKFNFTEFYTQIHIKLDILSKIAGVIEVGPEEITVDRYSHPKGTEHFELWIAVHTVGYMPCSDGQLAKISQYFNAVRAPSSKSTSGKMFGGIAVPSKRSIEELSRYNLQSVALEFLGPCLKRSRDEPKMDANNTTSIPVANLPNGPEGMGLQEDDHPIFSSPVIFVVVIATVLLVVIVVLYRSRSNDNCILRKSNRQKQPFDSVKTKNAPVVFAEEVAGLSGSKRLPSSNSGGPCKLTETLNHHHHHHHQPTGSICSRCSSSITPPPPPPAVPPDLSLPEMYPVQKASSRGLHCSFTLPHNRTSSLSHANYQNSNHHVNEKYLTLNNHVNNSLSAGESPMPQSLETGSGGVHANNVTGVNHVVHHANNYYQVKSPVGSNQLDQPRSLNGGNVNVTSNIGSLSDNQNCGSSSNSNSIAGKMSKYNSTGSQTHSPQSPMSPFAPILAQNVGGGGVVATTASFQSDSPRSSSSSSFRQLTALAEVQNNHPGTHQLQPQQNCNSTSSSTATTMQHHHQQQQNNISCNNTNNSSSLSPSANSPSSDQQNYHQNNESPSYYKQHQPSSNHPIANGGPSAQYTAVVVSGTNKVAGIQLLGPNPRACGNPNNPVALLYSPSIEHEV